MYKKKLHAYNISLKKSSFGIYLKICEKHFRMINDVLSYLDYNHYQQLSEKQSNILSVFKGNDLIYFVKIIMSYILETDRDISNVFIRIGK